MSKVEVIEVVVKEEHSGHKKGDKIEIKKHRFNPELHEDPSAAKKSK